MVERIRHLADHIITNSEYVARAYRGTKPVTVVHNALNGSWFSPYPEEKRRQMRLDLGLPIDAPVVGIVGAAHSLKGHFLLIQAARTVVAEMPRARFLVVAGGVSSEYRRTVRGTIKSLLGLPMDHLERMQRMVRHHGLVENFVYCGFRSDIPAVVSAMDVLVFPSLVPEGFGRPIIEGMAMGCPVIASDIGPSREIAADAAVYVPPGNADRLATGILAVLRDPQKASRLGRTGRQRFLDHFEMKAAVARLEAVYDQVLCAR
jgi:glycosyltransferase involved in cell wall biosynthesis